MSLLLRVQSLNHLFNPHIIVRFLKSHYKVMDLAIQYLIKYFPLKKVLYQLYLK